MKMHEEQAATVIPIIIRSCDWARTTFRKLKALPHNGDAITKWDDKDDAWLNVIQGIREAIDRQATKILVSKRLESGKNPYTVTKDFRDYLEDTGITLLHRTVNRVLLSDVFVEPYLKAQFTSSKSIVQTSPALSVVTTDTRCVIFGEEQQGKTTLLKQAFRKHYESGKYPVYLQGSEITSSDCRKVVENALSRQYEGFAGCKDSDVVVLLDDLDKTRVNERARAKLLDGINTTYPLSIATCSIEFSYVIQDIEELAEYLPYELMRFGHENRATLTEKWVSLGIEERISDEELYKRSSTLEGQLDAIIRRNIVPPKPIYIRVYAD